MDLSSILSMINSLFNNQQTSNTEPIDNKVSNNAKNDFLDTRNYQQNNYSNSTYTNNILPHFEIDKKTVSSSSFDKPIYPQAQQNEENQIVTTNNNANNITHILSNFLSNPQAINIIKQLLPKLNLSTKNDNILNNIFSAFNKSKTNTNSQDKEDTQDFFDINEYIKIDDS